jgi:hypothetical protein
MINAFSQFALYNITTRGRIWMEHLACVKEHCKQGARKAAETSRRRRQRTKKSNGKDTNEVHAHVG